MRCSRANAKGRSITFDIRVRRRASGIQLGLGRGVIDRTPWIGYYRRWDEQGEQVLTHSGRSLLRQASVLVFCCAAGVYCAPALAQSGPDPGPTGPSSPSPDPGPDAPATVSRSSPSSGTAQPSSAPTSSAQEPPASATGGVVQTSASESEAATTPGSSRRQARKLETPAPRKLAPKGPRREAAGAVFPLLPRADASPRDTALMVGGIALVVLVACDLLFLTRTTRALHKRG